MAWLRLFTLLSLLLFFPLSRADEHSHVYEDQEEVVLWMNTIGPYHNRQETYRYFSLPFCRGPLHEVSHYHETLGEALEGVELEFSGLDIRFKENTPKKMFCSIKLTEQTYKAFVYAIRNHYWYQMFIDDLPIWGIVGEMHKKADDGAPDPDHFMFTHKKLDIGYNADQIVDVNLTSEFKTKISIESNITFTYEVNWKISSVQFDRRYDKYLDPSFFQHRIHWFSIFNSFMMVIFLVGLVSMIMLRTLHKDYARYSHNEDSAELDRELGDEYGWKQVHTDVFRAPSFPVLFTCLIGTGYHLAITALITIFVALMGDSYSHRGSLLSTMIFVYAVTSPVCGYSGGALYARMGGKRWMSQMLLGACLFPGLLSTTSLAVNVVAMFYHSSHAIPITSMLAVLGIGLFVILPLNLVGTLLGRNISGQADHPCRVNTVPRPIPMKKWYMEPISLILLGGILPFGSIFIEVYFIFTSFWQYKVYYVFGFMMLVFLIMIVVTVCVTIVCAYFLLNSEDYRWQWVSWGSGASIAVYIYFYSFYYFFFKTKMDGLFQTVFYFGYTALGSVAIGVLCGTVGYVGVSMFVRKIYCTIKID